MAGTSPARDFASQQDVRAAIEGLSKDEFLRLHLAAKRALIGTEYKDPNELVNETVSRVMTAAGGAAGRRWPLDVGFIPFMVTTVKGIASDARESLHQRKTRNLEAMANEHGDAGHVLGRLGLAHPDVLDEVLHEEDRSESKQAAAADATIIDEYFKDDEQVSWMILGLKNGSPASEIKELANMTQLEYEAAKKRLHRGLDKILPGRRKK